MGSTINIQTPIVLEKGQYDELVDGLKEAVNVLQKVPNTRIKHDKYSSVYEAFIDLDKIVAKYR